MGLLEASTTVVLPALRSVLAENEICSLELSLSDELDGSVVLHLDARGEIFRDFIVQGIAPQTTPQEWRERLRSNLVDFVAESRFGWGENRDQR